MPVTTYITWILNIVKYGPTCKNRKYVKHGSINAKYTTIEDKQYVRNTNRTQRVSLFEKKTICQKNTTNYKRRLALTLMAFESSIKIYQTLH